MWQQLSRIKHGQSLIGGAKNIRAVSRSFIPLKKTCSILTALFLFTSFSFAAQGDDLSKIHQQIKQQEQKIAGQKAEQQKLQSTLKNQENQINNVIGKLRQTESDLKEIRKSISDTDKQIKQLQKQEKEQKAKKGPIEKKSPVNSSQKSTALLH